MRPTQGTKVNPLQLHDEVLRVIDAYYAFIFHLQLRIQFRLLKPHLWFNYLQIVGFATWKALPPNKRRKVFDLLCSRDEQCNPFYFIATHRHPTHALSDHLDKMYPNFNWQDLFHVHDVRESAIPGFRISKHILPYLVPGIPIIGLIFGAGDRALVDSVLEWFSPKSWKEHPLYFIYAFCVCYVVAFFSVFSFALWRVRHQMRRAGNILKYMAVVFGSQDTYESCLYSYSENPNSVC